VTRERLAPRIGIAIGLAGMAASALLVAAEPAWAQSITLNLGEEGGGATGRIIQLVVLVTILSLAPSILVMVTSFTRIVVVLSFLRTALGTPQTPPTQVLVSLALFLTLFVMMPTLETSYQQGIQPLIEGRIDEFEAFERAAEPFRAFMVAHVRDQDLALFMDIAKVPAAETVGDKPPLRALIPAFMISELRRAFEIGFLLFVPFLIIDMVVSSVLMAMGMMMLPPIMISLPFKIIFFVLVDGWYLVIGSLIRGYGAG
jgi:flagellar biosynthetic protein FliP